MLRTKLQRQTIRRPLSTALAGGLALTALPADAAESAYGIGIYMGRTFGGGKPGGAAFGIEGRFTAMPGWDPCEGPQSFWSGGGVARLDFPAWNRGRLVLGAIGTRTMWAVQATAELGLGVRLHEWGADLIAGLRGGISPLNVRFDHTFNQRQSHLTAGIGFNTEAQRGNAGRSCDEQ